VPAAGEVKLSLAQKKIAQEKYLWFTRINAISFGILGEGFLILYCVKVGAPDWLIGVITSMFYFTMPLMLLGKQLIARTGAAHAYGFSWLLRNISASFLLWVPWVERVFSRSAGLALLAVAGTGFYAFRSMGLTAMTPLIGDITSRQDRGQFISRAWLNFNLYYLIAIATIAYALSHSSSVLMFQVILGTGVIFGIAASLVVWKVPESPRLRISGKESLRETVEFFRTHEVSRKLLYAWTAAASGIMLVMPFSMLALKNGYRVGDETAILFVLVQVGGGIIGSFVNTNLLDRVGSRPMLVMYAFGLLLVALFWLAGPGELFLPHVVAIFLLVGMCNSGANSALSHYFLNSTPALNRVAASMVLNIASGVGAGITGSLIASGLLKFFHDAGYSGIGLYRFYFGAILVLLVAVVLTVARLPALVPRGIRDVLGILFSFRDWRALYVLQKLAKVEEGETEEELVSRLQEIGSDLSEGDLVRFLESPRFYVRAKAIRALGHIQISPSTARRLMREVEEGEFTTGYLAAEVLGEKRVRAAIPVLRRALYSKDVFLQGKAILALGKLQDRSSLPEILAIFRVSENPRILIHAAMAFAEYGDPALLEPIFEKLASGDIFPQATEELLYAASEIGGCEELFYAVYRLFKKNPEEAYYELLNRVEESEVLYGEEKSLWRELFENLLNRKQAKLHLEKLFQQFLAKETEVIRSLWHIWQRCFAPAKKVDDRVLITFLIILFCQRQRAFQ
jgi:MFS family permease